VQDLSKIARPSIAHFKESGALMEKPKGRKTLVPQKSELVKTQKLEYSSSSEEEEVGV